MACIRIRSLLHDILPKLLSRYHFRRHFLFASQLDVSYLANSIGNTAANESDKDNHHCTTVGLHDEAKLGRLSVINKIDNKYRRERQEESRSSLLKVKRLKQWWYALDHANG